MTFVKVLMSQMNGVQTVANMSMDGTTARAICSVRCMAMRLGTSSEMTMAKYEMTSVSSTVVKPEAKARPTPQRIRQGTTAGEMDAAPKDAERKPVNVVPICTAERNRLGL